MGENTEGLVVSLENSLSSDICDTVGDLAEVGLDAVMDDGILKDIPILSTVVGLYRIGHTIRERHTIKQLALFVAELNKGCADDRRRKQLLEKLNSDTRKSKQEIEYILVLLDSYLEYEKPQILAKLYIAYLEKTITWTEFAKYAAALDRIFPTDVEMLKEHDFKKKAIICKQSESERILRLISAGFMYEQTASYYMGEDASEITDYETAYSITAFGQKFIDIVG